jgi:hypothetical protein
LLLLLMLLMLLPAACCAQTAPLIHACPEIATPPPTPYTFTITAITNTPIQS